MLEFGRFGEKISLYIFKELVHSLEFLHAKGYCHKDVKPENMLFDKDFNTLLCDFGFAEPLVGEQGDNLQRTFTGTNDYMAPEIIGQKPFDGRAADIFALGKTIFAYIKGGFPFSRATSADSLYNLIIMKQFAKFWAFHTQRKTANFSPSPEFRDIFQKLVDPNPATRITIAEIKCHPWFMAESATKEEFVEFFSSRRLQSQGSIDLQVQNASQIIQQFKEAHGEIPLFRSATEKRLSILEAIPAADMELKQKATILKDTSSVFSSRFFYTGFAVEELFKCLVTYCKRKGEIKTLDKSNFKELLLTELPIAHSLILRFTVCVVASKQPMGSKLSFA